MADLNSNANIRNLHPSSPDDGNDHIHEYISENQDEKYMFNNNNFSFESCESIFATSMLIQQRIHEIPHDYVSILTNHEDIDTSEWIYEHIRQICIELNLLVTYIMPVCKSPECSLMSYDQIEYLCAAHQPEPIRCPALFYTCHTLNIITHDLNNLPEFKVRLCLNFDEIKGTICCIARRLIRIFGHCFLSHKVQFEQFNHRALTCERFLYLCKTYNLLDFDCEPSASLYEQLIQSKKASYQIQSNVKIKDNMNQMLDDIIEDIDMSDDDYDDEEIIES